MDGGTIVATRPVPPASSDLPGALADPPRIFRVALLATLLGLLAFLVIQTSLAVYNIGAIRDAAARDMYEISSWDRLTILTRLFPRTLVGIIDFVALAITGSVIARRGHRVLFALPAVAYVFASVFVSPHHPEPLGFQWSLECFSWDVTYTTCAVPWFGHAWLGPTVDLTLVLVPGWMVARRVRPRRWPGPVDRAVVAAILACSAAVVTAVWAMVVIQNSIDLRAVVAVGAIGLITSVTNPRWLWYHVLVALALGQAFARLLDFVFWPEPTFPLSAAWTYLLADTWPIVAVGLIASAWQPFAWLVRRLQDRPIRLVLAVNVLNVADAVMTLLAVRSGGAYESNPVVRLVGLPAKVVLVGLLTWLVYRRKPSALVWPFAALTLVAAYHFAGIIVNGWR
jgi:uncharacterized protein DUF5658